MTPHCCPVCRGALTVPAGFYDRNTGGTSTAPEPCRTCKGEGIVWEPNAFQFPPSLMVYGQGPR